MNRIRQAVVLAAGRGARMGEMTAEMPKPMLRIQGKPILEHVLDRLAEAGVERFFVVIGYRREVIVEHFHNWRLPIQFRVQEPVNGTGSAARLARDFTRKDPFLVTFGDILCDPAAYLACAAALGEKTEAVMGVRHVDDPYQGAAVYERGGLIYRVLEKPPKGASQTNWNSAGLYVLRPTAYKFLERLTPSPRNEFELTQVFDLMLGDGREVRIAPIDGLWRDIGRPEDLAALNGL